MRRSKRKFLLPILLCSFSLVIFLFLELFLQFSSNLLPTNLKNILTSKYNSRPDGIYFRDNGWSIYILKPNYRQEIFYNGYKWLHQTNAIGIRDNRNIERADIVVLGDSFIYGHGINIEDTSSYFLEKLSGKVVANFGVQGDYPPSQYLRLKHLGLFLRPKIVLFFISGIQDASDFLIFRPKKEYIEKIISEGTLNYSGGLQFSDYLRNYQNFQYKLKDYLCYWFLTLRLSRGLLGAYRNKLRILKKITNFEKNENTKMIKDSMKKILLSVQELCRSNNSELILIINANKENIKNDWKEIYKENINSDFNFYEFCKEISADFNIPLLDLKEKSPKDKYFLKNDGHYSSEGNNWAANCIYEYLKEKNFL